MAHLLLGSEALADGAVTRRELARRYRMVYRNVYCLKGDEVSAGPPRRCTAAGGFPARIPPS